MCCCHNFPHHRYEGFMLNRLSPGSQTYKLKRFFFIFMPDCSLKNCFRIRRKRLLEKENRPIVFLRIWLAPSPFSLTSRNILCTLSFTCSSRIVFVRSSCSSPSRIVSWKNFVDTYSSTFVLTPSPISFTIGILSHPISTDPGF